MSFSINTNSGALSGLRELNKTNKDLNITQKHISTGKKVNDVKDNAAILNIAQQLYSDISGLGAAKQSLDGAISKTDVAMAGAETIQNLLIELREKAVAAKDPGLDADSRAALNQEFNALKEQVTTIVDNSSFNGTNALKGDDISAIQNEDGSSVTTLTGKDLSLGGAVVTLGAGDDLSSAANADAALAAIDSSITNVGATLADLGASAKSFEQQKDFITKLNDTIEVGISNLVDADMAKEAANLISLQIKQELSLKTLSIANKAPSTVLSLFNT
jgi:flagellin